MNNDKKCYEYNPYFFYDNILEFQKKYFKREKERDEMKELSRHILEQQKWHTCEK